MKTSQNPANRRAIIVIAHNLRSSHNVGSLLRTAEGLGIQKVFLSGHTPYPFHANLQDENTRDERLPHIARKLDSQISKTALGAEKLVDWEHKSDIFQTIQELHDHGWTIAALEQTSDSIPLPEYRPPDKLVIILGREVEGLESEVVALCDDSLEIPMFGSKESFNVVQAAAMALYHCRFVI